MSKPMTNYNERLDDLTSFMESIGWEFDENGYTFDDNYINFRTANILRQAITSLIKELVAEAKPDKRELIEPITGKPVSRGDKVTVDVEADPRGSFIFVQNNGYNMALNQFEQNLLKALEEV